MGHQNRGDDYGGAKNSVLLKRTEHFFKDCPNQKWTFYFVPNPLYRDRPDFSEFLERPYFNIVKNNNHPLISWLHHLTSEGLIEICQHGLHHIRLDPPYDFYSSFEFDFISPLKCFSLVEEGYHSMSKVFEVKGFKPPAWSCGQLDGRHSLIEALKRGHNFSHLSLSSPSNGLNFEKQITSHIHGMSCLGSTHVPQNVSILWTEDEIKRVSSAIIKKNGIVNIQLHFVESRRG